MPAKKSTDKSTRRRGAPLRRGSRRVEYNDRAKLRHEVLRQCVRELKPVWGRILPHQLWDNRVRQSLMPDVEVRAQRAYGLARRALRGLLAAVPEGKVCGPCTAFVDEHRQAIEGLTRDADKGRGKHWRQQSADRLSSPTSIAVDLWGSTRMTIGDRTRALTARELACISLLNGAAL